MTQRLSASVIAALAVALLTAAPAVRAEDLKVGVVNSDRILRDSQPARAAMQKLEAEFSQRDKAMQEMGARLKANAERFEKDGPIMSESDRVRRQRELAEADRSSSASSVSFARTSTSAATRNCRGCSSGPTASFDRSRSREVRPDRAGGRLLQSAHRYDRTCCARSTTQSSCDEIRRTVAVCADSRHR
jgi:Skp family chaperone for outer membrane proteins